MFGIKNWNRAYILSIRKILLGLYFLFMYSQLKVPFFYYFFCWNDKVWAVLSLLSITDTFTHLEAKPQQCNKITTKIMRGRPSDCRITKINCAENWEFILVSIPQRPRLNRRQDNLSAFFDASNIILKDHKHFIWK